MNSVDNKEVVHIRIKEVLREIKYIMLGITKLGELVQKEINSSNLDWAELFNAQAYISLYLYVHMSVIVKLLELKDKCISKRLGLFRRIQIVRNNMLIHREKRDFFKIDKEKITASSKSNSITFTVIYRDNNGKKEIELNPLEDVQDLESLLKQKKIL